MEMALVVRAEQSPNPDSRVTLDRSVDAIGMPRIRLNWQLQDLDVKTVSEVVDALGRDAAKMGLGHVEKAEWLNGNAAKWVSDRQVSAHHIGGYHHMGTTRMSDDPKSGVTDQWGRVHGIANLYVAGSSLFPTAGWANPTLTILALALRTSEHLLEGSNR
jgi:choline dehydrogenase-like flavoprotein